MPLRVRLTDMDIQPDRLIVTHEVAWANSEGQEVWSKSTATEYPSTVTQEQVVNDILQSAQAQEGMIAAVVALEALMAKTYEYVNGKWRVVQ